jgi:hypothetical protein
VTARRSGLKINYTIMMFEKYIIGQNAKKNSKKLNNELVYAFVRVVISAVMAIFHLLQIFLDAVCQLLL